MFVGRLRPFSPPAAARATNALTQRLATRMLIFRSRASMPVNCNVATTVESDVDLSQHASSASSSTSSRSATSASASACTTSHILRVTAETERVVTPNNRSVRMYLGENGRRYPSVTTILDGTQPVWRQQILSKWRDGLIEKLGAVEACEYVHNILNRGTDLHELVEAHLLHPDSLKITTKMRAFWLSIADVLPRVSEPTLLESAVISHKHGFAGTVDCVAKLDGELTVIDWKTSSTPKRTVKALGDYVLQISAYRQALMDQGIAGVTENTGAAIIVVYDSGSPANVFKISAEECDTGFSDFLARHSSFRAALPLTFSMD